MTAFPNARSMLSSAIDTVSRPYADATATMKETVSRVSSSNFSSIDEAFPRSSSLLCFLLLCTDECTGNGGPGLMECSATADRLGLGLVGLEGDALGSSALLARNRDNQLFLGLGRRRVRAKTARGTFNRLDFGDGRDSSVDGSCSQRRRQDNPCQTPRNLLAGACTRSCDTASERISSQRSLAEPGLRRQRSRQ